MRTSSLFYLVTGFFILFAIPATVFMVRSEQSRATQASPDFDNAPILELTANAYSVRPGDEVEISIKADYTNWIVLYFLPGDLLNYNTENLVAHGGSPSERPNGIVFLHQSSSQEPFRFKPSSTGYIVGNAYQLSNFLVNYRNGDILCGWNKDLYLYKIQRNILDGFFEEEQKKGAWEKLTSCMNSGPLKIVVQ